MVAGGAGDQTMTYDSLDRLTEAEGPYGTGGATASITYSYNEIGNLTANSQVGSYTYPTSGSSSVRPHAVSTAGSNTYSYDANGNMTAGAGRSFTYNLENKPLTITIGGQTTTFVYDGDNGRVKKIVGSTTTRYISQLYECENTSCSRMIFAGSERVATLVPSGGVHYYHPDHLGSSSVITDETGAKVQALTYYPYGATRTNNSPVTPAVNVPYKYTGKELDASTDLYYYGARYYDPLLARFLSADTLVPNPRDPQELNRYTYAGSNPFLYTDPTGHFKIKFTKFFQRALGDVGTAVVGVLGQSFGGTLSWTNPLLGAVVSGLGTAVLTQSKTGRYTLAGEIVVASAVASFACGGCGATVTFPLVGAQVSAIPASATVGAIGVGTLGGISAAKAGGDISSGVLVGTALGAASGALNGYLGALSNQVVASGGLSFASFGSAGPLLYAGGLNMAGATILNAASGAAIGYGGGRGDVNTMLQTGGRSVAGRVTTSSVTAMLGVALGLTGPPQDFKLGWEGGLQLTITKSMAVSVANFVTLFGGNAPQWSELENDRLRQQMRKP